MQKASKILIPVVVVLIVAGGIIFWFVSKGVLPVQAEEIPCGLEWGMSEAEATGILAQTEGYTRDEDHFLIVYEVDDYQGMDGVDGIALLGIDENAGLVSVRLQFKVEESQGGKMEKDKLDKLRKGCEKAYEKQAGEMFEGSSDFYFQKFYLKEKSLVCLSSLFEEDVWLEFYSLESPYSQEQLAQLRAK